MSADRASFPIEERMSKVIKQTGLDFVDEVAVMLETSGEHKNQDCQRANRFGPLEISWHSQS